MSKLSANYVAENGKRNALVISERSKMKICQAEHL